MKTDRMTGFDFTNTSLSAWEIHGYVQRRLGETGNRNIAIRIPAMTPVMKRAMEKYYKIDLEPFGYVRFEPL